jgi:hypothetical protein
MAPLAPPIQEIDTPDYLRLPHSISGIATDESGKILGDTIGKGLSSVGKVGDKITESYLDDAIHSQIDPEMDKKNQDLAATINMVQKGTISDDQGNPVNVNDLLKKPEAERTPTDLKNLETMTNNLRQGKEHGVYNDTYFRMKMDAVAKDFRSRFPGFRDYIDEKIKGAEGSTANQLAQAQIQTLNDLLGQRDKEKDKVENHLLSNLGEPLVYEAWVGMKKGTVTPEEALKTVATALGRKATTAQQEAEIRLKTAQRQDTSVDAEQLMNRRAHEILDNNWNRVQTAGGELKTGAMAQKFIEDVNTGKRQDSPEQMIQAGSVIRAVHQRTQAELEAEFNKPYPGDPNKTYAQVLGPEKVQKLRESNDQFLDHQEKAFFNKDTGSMAYGKMVNDAKVTAGESYLLKSDAGKLWALEAAANKLGGPQVGKEAFDKMIQDPSMDKVLKTWAASEGFELQLNPPDMRKTLEKVVSDTVSKAPAEAAPKLIKFQFDNLKERFTDPNMPDGDKFNLAKTAFGPGNEKLWDNIKEDRYDNKDRFYPGKFFFFHQLTSPDMVNEAKRLGQTDAQTWRNYKTTVVSWAGRSLIPSAIKELNEVQTSPYANIAFDPDNTKLVSRDLNVSTINQRFPAQGMKVPGSNVRAQQGDAEGIPGIQLNPRRSLSYDQVQADVIRRKASIAIEQINSVLDTFKNIAIADNVDPNLYVVQTLRDLGWDASKEGTLPDQIMQGIKSSLQGPQKFKNTFDDAYGNK